MSGATGGWIGDDFYVTEPEHQILFQFVRLTPGALDPVLVRVQATGLGRLLFWDRFSLGSHRSRATAAGALAKAYPLESWPTMVDEACRLAFDVVRGGPVPLQPAVPDPAQWLLPGVIPRNEVTVLYGDGGAGKSRLALALAIGSVTGTPIGPWAPRACRRACMLDWEGSERTQQARLWGLLEGMDVQPGDRVLHWRMREPFTQAVGEIKRQVSKQGIDLLIVDSLGAAATGERESAESALAVLGPLAALDVTALVIAHVAKSTFDRPGPSRPYGSVYVWNQIRSALEVRRMPTEETDELLLTVSHEKNNDGPKAPAVGLRFVFDGEGRVLIRQTEPDVAFQPIGQLLLDALRRNGPMETPDLAKETERKPTEVRAALNRMEKANVVERVTERSGGRGNKTQWQYVHTNRTLNRTEPNVPAEPPF